MADNFIPVSTIDIIFADRQWAGVLYRIDALFRGVKLRNIGVYK
jgi:hypothetical protein